MSDVNSKISSLPPVAEMMRSAGLEPKKQLGQNFLFDLNLTRKIARSVPNIGGATVIEVGPGPGGLTRALLECGAARVIAIERDRATKPILDQIVVASDGRLDVVYEDALKVFDDGESYNSPLGLGVNNSPIGLGANNSPIGLGANNSPLGGSRRAVTRAGGGTSSVDNTGCPPTGSSVALMRAETSPTPPKGGVIRLPDSFAICSNLPYNIGTELLIQWLHMIGNVGAYGIRPKNIANKGVPAFAGMTNTPLQSLTLMFQREVAERIVARVGDKQYGRLSVLTALVADAKILFDVPNTAFVPQPKVQSAVVQIVPKRESRSRLRGNDNSPVGGGAARRAGEGASSDLSAEALAKAESNNNTNLDFNLKKPPLVADGTATLPPYGGETRLPDIETLTARLFGNRRKMIRGIMPGVDWTRFGLTGTERAEELPPQKFVELADGIEVKC